MSVDVKRLRELAEAATPGPWVTASGKGSAVVRTEHPDFDCAIYLNVRTCETECTLDRWQADARFIAGANPISVIQLVEGILRLQRKLADMTEARNELGEIAARWTVFCAEERMENRGSDQERIAELRKVGQ